MRRTVAMLLLWAQVAAGLHLALAGHVTADTGAVVDAQPACPQSHDVQGIAHGHEPTDDDECGAVALLHTASWASAGAVVTAPVGSGTDASGLGGAPAVAPLELLDVAPKASPPTLSA
jgi:hypothetical protein